MTVQAPAANERQQSNVVFKAFNAIMARSKLALGLNQPFGGKRNLNEVFGWQETISAEDFRKMYNRGGIAKRLVHAYPDATWGRPPEIWAQAGNDPNQQDEVWNKAWAEFVKRYNLWDVLYRLDVLAGLGRYGVLLIGNGQPLNTTMRKKPGPGAAQEIIFLQPFGEDTSAIQAWDEDVTSSNFGKPKTYRLTPDYKDGPTTNGMSMVTQVRRAFTVDYTRVLHVTHGTLESNVYGLPLYAPVYDYLSDLRKVVGSSSESYWLTAYRGMHVDIDKELELDPTDEANLSAEVDEYVHGFRRFIRTRGTSVKALESDVADPRGAFDVLITLISGTTGIPKRILLGSEAGQLASVQDKGNWAERVEEYRTLHAEPYILVPFIQKMIAIGALPAPQGDAEVRILWPDAYRMSPLERGQTAAQTARTLANTMKAMEPTVVGYKTETVAGPPGLDGAPGPSVTKEIPIYGEPLITREEARAIIGMSSDNRVLAQDPNI